MRPRSGLAVRHGVTVLNAPGTIDEGYRGEVGVILINHGPAPFEVTPGARIAQLVVQRRLEDQLMVGADEANQAKITQRGEATGCNRGLREQPHGHRDSG